MNSADEWETDSDDAHDTFCEDNKKRPNNENSKHETYYRVKFDNVNKVRNDIQKIVKLCSRKYKRIDPEAREKLKKVNRFLNEEISRERYETLSKMDYETYQKI